MPMSMTPIPSREMEKYISRCSVCETTTRLIALHSQSMEIPDCPQGWEEAWIGYSYYMQTSDTHGNSHQSLISPGSCLEEFRAQPIIECHGRGTCNILDGITSFWLSVIEDSEQFRIPKQRTLKADQTSKVSRCSVCRKVERTSRVPRPIPTPALAYTQREPEVSRRGDISYSPQRGDVSYAPLAQPLEQQAPPPPPPRRRRPNASRQNQQLRLRNGQNNRSRNGQ